MVAKMHALSSTTIW